jgi:transposase-like protein/IS1 family transposase
MVCHNCEIEAKKSGKTRKGAQRFKCNQCNKTFSEYQDKLLEGMYLPTEKAVLCLNLLLEGMSVRSVQRITGVEKKTILKLLVLAGEKAERLFDERVKNIKVTDLQADEIRKGIGEDETVGSTYTFTAIESNTKLIVAWHLGNRTREDTEIFVEKIYDAIEGTTNKFQMSTDGFPAYKDALSMSLGTRVDYGQIIKIYGNPNPDEVRYSAGDILEIIKKKIIGNPDKDLISTSYVERANLTMRMSMRRFTRLTNAFSKKWYNLKCALALYFAHYNFCRIHSTLRCTPAMEAGLTKTVWSLEDLLTY